MSRKNSLITHRQPAPVLPMAKSLLIHRSLDTRIRFLRSFALDRYHAPDLCLKVRQPLHEFGGQGVEADCDMRILPRKICRYQLAELLVPGSRGAPSRPIWTYRVQSRIRGTTCQPFIDIFLICSKSILANDIGDLVVLADPEDFLHVDPEGCLERNTVSFQTEQ